MAKGQTRYGHVFSKGRSATGWVRYGSWHYAGVREPPTMTAAATGKSRKIGELILTRTALSVGCEACQKARREISPWEAVALYGHELRIDEVREVMKRRCPKGQDRCDFVLTVSAGSWNPRGRPP
jgi:hypothetical protein